MRRSSLIWDRVVSYWIEQSHMGQNRLIWDRAGSYRTEESHMGQNKLIWDRAGSYGTEQSHMGQGSLIWDKAVSYGTEPKTIHFNILHNFLILELVHRNCQTPRFSQSLPEAHMGKSSLI